MGYPPRDGASQVGDGARPTADTGNRLRVNPGGRVANARYHHCCASYHDIATRYHHCCASYHDIATRYHHCCASYHDIATRYHHCCARYHGSRRCDQPLRSSQAGTGTLPRCVHAGA
mgnify:FL=1